ncbi:TlpA family protein disulfide reductase [Nocardioides marmoriginsengisoli]|uniref:TlpA family protein disulfide reductase n=1 Tax=Nocardioides marmoriginsengisoli TaxID=661483 RepID=A0A3N0CG49_9ACTN|nr:TlpA disulfide reductase family protein [Nocardioides marmoriginsengisoli]RNL62279.1 TlpA family protein disulfide reductase [Nocardioides marmoriginsengisoli]
MRRPRSVVVLLAVAFALLTAGCGVGFDGLDATGDKGYIDGEGVITRLPVGERVKPGEVSGTTLDGEEVSLSSYAGKVIVINVWGSWCPPCRAEADELAAAANEVMPKGVVFLGINTRDTSADNARAFERAQKVPYPSIYDPGGENLLAFHRTLSPNSIPSTVIIDKQGRVAASVMGQVTSARTLVDLIEDVSK